MIFLYVIHFFLHVSKCSDVPTFSHIFRFLHVPIIVFPWFYHVFLNMFPYLSTCFPYVPMVSPWFSNMFPFKKWFSYGFPMVFPWFSASSGHFPRRRRRRRRRRPRAAARPAAPSAHRAAAAAGRSPSGLWPGGKVDLWKIYNMDRTQYYRGGSSHLVSGL